jgi:hypothetical protein
MLIWRTFVITQASGIAAGHAGMKFHQWRAAIADQIWQ